MYYLNQSEMFIFNQLIHVQAEVFLDLIWM